MTLAVAWLVAVWEYVVIQALHPIARRAGLRVLSTSGSLAQDAFVPSVPGFKLRAFREGAYLVRPVAWWEPRPSADPLQPWAVGILTVIRGRWALKARSGVGLILFVGIG